MKKYLKSPPDKSYAYVWDGVLLYAPTAITNSMHSHFAATVLIAIDQPFSLAIEGSASQNYDIAVLAPNVARETDSHGAPLIDFLIDPDDPLYCFLHPLLTGNPVASFSSQIIADIKPRFAGIFDGQIGCDGALRIVQDVLSALCPQPLTALPWDARVQQANRYMRDCLPETVPVVAEIAEQVSLSESRFMHLFREQMGLPVRQYLLWLRIRQAMRYWAEGQPLAEVALAAGFYDQAHFTRTIRRMTDYAPSMISDPENMVRQYCGCT